MAAKKKPVTTKQVIKIKSTASTIKTDAALLLKDVEKIQGNIGIKSKLAGNLGRALRNIINGTPKSQLNESLSDDEIKKLLADIKSKIKSDF